MLSITSMDIAVPRLPCYLAEWYRPEVTEAALGTRVLRVDAR